MWGPVLHLLLDKMEGNKPLLKNLFSDSAKAALHLYLSYLILPSALWCALYYPHSADKRQRLKDAKWFSHVYVVNEWHSFCEIKSCLTLKWLLFAVNHTDTVHKTCKILTVYHLSTLKFIVTQILKRILQRAQLSILFSKDERVCMWTW